MKELSYRWGHVIKDEMTFYACCRIIPKELSLFDYIEVMYEDGTLRFFYQDREGFEHFERNFVSKRFTSYHEFFTTKESAVEQRGSLKLKYYIRRSYDCYIQTDLEAKEKELDQKAAEGSVRKLEDRITQYGNYAGEI